MSLDSFFNPKNVAVVGASPQEGNLGSLIIKNMLKEFKGNLYTVNPNEAQVFGVQCYARLEDLPKCPDLVVIIVPGHIVDSIVETAGQLNIPAIIIISAGFSEAGHIERELRLLHIKQKSRILGPNCLGVIDRYSGLNTVFPSTLLPNPGIVGLILQSGAFGIDIMTKFSLEDVPLSKFTSYGNAVDINETELLEYYADDPTIQVIGMYLEGVHDPNFRDAAERVTNKKPVVCLIAGGGYVGKATSSHTGTIASDMRIFEGVCRQLGIFKVNTTTEFVDALKALSNQPIPLTTNSVIVSNVGGPGMCALMHCRRVGLPLASISSSTINTINDYLVKRNLHSTVLKNENGLALGFIDATGSATANDLIHLLDLFLAEKTTGGGIMLARSDSPFISDEMPELIKELQSRYPTKPILVYDLPGSPSFEGYGTRGIPVYPAPERAVDGMHALIDRSRFLTHHVTHK